jgi:hypothetical protein
MLNLIFIALLKVWAKAVRTLAGLYKALRILAADVELLSYYCLAQLIVRGELRRRRRAGRLT